VPQSLGLIGGQRVQPKLRVVGLAAPAGLVFGPATDEQEESGGREALDQSIEQGLGLRIDPVQILDDKEQGLTLALPEQETLDRIQHPLAALQGIERLPREILDRYV